MDTTSDRINSLVAGISEKLLDAARVGSSFTNFQGSIDTALTEISELLGQSLTLGGSENSDVRGLDSSQIKDLEILSLPPNASARFSGGITQQAGNAEIMITDAGRLQGGGTLDLKVGDSERRIQFQPGRSISGMAQQINSKNVGVKAMEVDGKLRLTSRTSQSLEATVRPIRTGRNYGDNQLFGVNESQVDRVDLSRLSKGVSQTIQGQVDSVATVARLTYQGSAGGLVSGSANFDLTGDLGTENVETTRGESLISFAEKINNVSAFTGVRAEVNGNELRLVSQLRGDDAEVRLSNVVRQFRPTIEGVNAAQIPRFDLQSIADGAEVNLSGTVTTAADAAKLQYQGSGGNVVDTAVFTLSGNSGSEQIAIAQGEALTDVRDRINAETESTGVVATVDGDTLQFRGQAVGSSESIQVTLDDITQYVDVEGVNASQIQGFTVNSSEPRSTNILSGTVDQTATKGQLTYDGFWGAATSRATFHLTGELGTVEMDVSTFQSLSSLRDDINDQTGDTGVVATLSGSTLTLESQNEGSKGTVEVDVISGSFSTDGGDGNGNAAGTDAQLTINGEAVTADGNQVDYTDSLGSYSFDVQSGFTGAFEPIEVTTSDGDFDLTGGDETGTAYGVDAEATINGQSFVADGNEFEITIDSAVMSFDLDTGFLGAIDPITLRSEEDEFSVTGGDGNGNANGQDGQATINGETYTSATNTFEVSVGESSIDLEFVDEFVGALDAFEIDSEVTMQRRTGTPSTYASSAKSEQFAINGQAVDKVDGRYEFEQGGVRIGFQLAEGFRGSFENFTITANGAASELYRGSQMSSLTGTALEATQTALVDLFQLASGGKYDSQNSDALDAYNVTKETLVNLQSLLGVSTSRGRSLNGLLFDQNA
ncbi:flagellin hook IN motif-containing protein [Rhodopirellula sp. P2]|uniref:flagellin hook IN motif-containing protein n=1 Tax=Rhodopirellula sp. P2 TaxID=2127060 RepID=UPI002367BB28|nr:flagellin hook IN motif-containing protein [Rhodopirellula sp. P2]WDQ17709.1 flagellin hook IN motif-containing protein [Rhodopirellula sp. P2]